MPAQIIHKTSCIVLTHITNYTYINITKIYGTNEDDLSTKKLLDNQKYNIFGGHLGLKVGYRLSNTFAIYSQTRLLLSKIDYFDNTSSAYGFISIQGGVTYFLRKR